MDKTRLKGAKYSVCHLQAAYNQSILKNYDYIYKIKISYTKQRTETALNIVGDLQRLEDQPAQDRSYYRFKQFNGQ